MRYKCYSNNMNEGYTGEVCLGEEFSAKVEFGNEIQG